MNPSTLALCQKHLFTDKDELAKLYEESVVSRVLRIRQMYEWRIAHPSEPDRKLVEEEICRFRISQRQAYSDLGVIKQLAPMLSKASREFHLWRTNEMLLETYNKAKRRNNTKDMLNAADKYARYNRVDREEDTDMPYDEIVVQPFCATDDPRVLGIKPIPNIGSRIKQLLEKYTAEAADIEDVAYEEADLEEDELFPDEPQLPKTDEDAIV